jgi:hypothetical protein
VPVTVAFVNSDLQQHRIVLPTSDQVARFDSKRGAVPARNRCEDAFAFRLPQARFNTGEFDLDQGRMSDALQIQNSA